MMDKALLEKIKKLNDSEECDVEIEALVEKALQKEPFNTELWLRLTIVEIEPRFGDGYKATECLNKIFEYDKNNIKALLLLTYVQFYLFGVVEESLYEKLCEVGSEDNEKQSMLEYAKALYFYNVRLFVSQSYDYRYEKCLLKSIELANKHVNNHNKLAKYYLNCGRYEEAREHLVQALQNIQGVYFTTRMLDDYTDVDEFLANRFKGIYLTNSQVEFIQEALDKANRKILSKS